MFVCCVCVCVCNRLATKAFITGYGMSVHSQKVGGIVEM